MPDAANKSESFELPDDLIAQIRELAERIGESPRFVVLAAVDHFFRIPEEQRKAVLRGTSLRRR